MMNGHIENDGINKNIQKKDEKLVVSYNNEFFDISEFSHKHPGGINTLKGLNNRSMDERFNEVEHSRAALYLMKEYKVKAERSDYDLNGNVVKNGNVNGSVKQTANGSANGSIKGTTNGSANGSANGNVEGIANGSANGSVKGIANGSANRSAFNFEPDESLEYLVDWDKPMLSQIKKLGDKYEDWVNLPVDRPLRLFQSDYLEALTKTPWYIVPMFWIPIISYIFYSEAMKIPSDQNKLFVLSSRIVMGITIWSILEYTLHRYVFHINVKNKNLYYKIFHFLIHGLHHKVPFDDKRLVFPPFPAVILATILYQPVRYFDYPFLLLCGGLIGYLAYDLTHYFIHYGSPKSDSYFYRLKRTHNHHHFTAHDKGFGISSSFWDNIFGTTIALKKLKYVLKW